MDEMSIDWDVGYEEYTGIVTQYGEKYWYMEDVYRHISDVQKIARAMYLNPIKSNAKFEHIRKILGEK